MFPTSQVKLQTWQLFYPVTRILTVYLLSTQQLGLIVDTCTGAVLLLVVGIHHIIPANSLLKEMVSGHFINEDPQVPRHLLMSSRAWQKPNSKLNSKSSALVPCLVLSLNEPPLPNP